MNVGFNTFDPTEGLQIPSQNKQVLENKVNKSYLSTSIGLAFRKLDVFGYYTQRDLFGAPQLGEADQDWIDPALKDHV
mgnify:CR=1 FL=1